jgi:hypothetical protein
MPYDDLIQRVEMLTHEMVCFQIAELIIECGRSFQVSKQESNVAHTQAFIIINHFRAIEIAKRLRRQ